jgi:hypothetical protein
MTLLEASGGRRAKARLGSAGYPLGPSPSRTGQRSPFITNFVTPERADMMEYSLQTRSLDFLRGILGGIAALILCITPISGYSQESAPEKPAATPKAEDTPGQTEVKPPQNPVTTDGKNAAQGPTLSEDQAAIKEQYKRLEKSMLDMAEFIRKTEPERADILFRAVNNSKENGVFREMEDLVKLLSSEDQLGDAVERQGEVVSDLQTLLDLLMSDDREKELAKEKARIEQYIKDLTKIIAGQKDVHAATDRGDQAQGLTPRQEKLAEKTAELKKLIEEEDKKAKAQEDAATKEAEQPDKNPDAGKPEGKSEDSKSPDGTPKEPKAAEPKPGDEKPGDKKPADGDQPQDSKPEGEKPGDPKSDDNTDKKPMEGGDAKPMKSAPMPDSPKPDDSKPAEPKPGDSKPGDSKPGQPMPGESPEN